MRDDCVLCEKKFASGDRGVVIGNIDDRHIPELVFVHIDCIGRSIVGDKWDEIKAKAEGVADEVVP